MLSRKQKYWAWVLAWTVGVYACIPVGRPVCEAIRKTGMLNMSVTSIVFGCLIVFLLWLIKQGKADFKRVGLFVVVLVFVGGVLILLGIPEEKIHIIQYAPLAYLIFRAAKEDMPAQQAYIVAFILTSVLGLLDEQLQAITPGRFFGWLDVVLNSIGAAVGLVLTFIAQEDPKRK